LFIETPAKTIADDADAEKVSLNNVKVDAPPPNLDSSGSMEHDADESEASTEADVDEGSPNKDLAAKKRKKISKYSIIVHVSNTNNFVTLFSEAKLYLKKLDNLRIIK